MICGTAGEDVYVNREEIVEWIYGLGTVPTTLNKKSASKDDSAEECCVVGGGFKGSNYLGPVMSDDSNDNTNAAAVRHPYDHSHIAMTYVALCTLQALGDDLSRIDKHAILSTLQGLQKPNGSFVALSPTTATSTTCDGANDNDSGDVEAEDDCDLRFMYAAIAVWYILTSHDDQHLHDDKKKKDDYINIETATQYILSCKSYEGALGLTPGREGHGGSTFCGIASLYLLGVLDDVMSREELRGWKDELIYWCVMRQKSLIKRLVVNVDDNGDGNNNGYVQDEEEQPAGMVGRPNKKEDTCYSYWIGGTLHLLSSSHLMDGWALREYVLKCQSPYGGFGKVVGAMPDLLHSFYSMAWLTLSAEDGCCDEEDDDEEDDDDDEVNVVYESEMRTQVRESIDKLSKLDCALGMCAKRIR